MTKDPYLRAKKDPLVGFFRWGRKLFPIVNSHVCIVENEINPAILNLALRRIIDRFEQLHDLFAADEEASRRLLSGDVVAIASPNHPISFDAGGFRETLMALISVDERANGSHRPVRLHLVQAADRRRTCLHLGITHDVADVKSGNIFLVELMREYTRLAQEEAPAIGADKEREVIFEHLPLEQLEPGWFTLWSQIVRWAKANLGIAWRMVSRARTRVSFPASAGSPAPPETKTDFRHIVLSQQLVEGMLLAARRSKVTINTLFCAALVRYIGRSQRKNHPLAVYTIAVSLRKLLGPAYAETFRSYMIDCTLRIPHALENQELLSRIEEDTAAARRDGLQFELGRMESAVTLFKSPLPRAIVLWIMGRTQGTNILYSNPGIVEEDFSSFGPEGAAISAMAIFGCLVPPYDLMFHTPTIGGKLQLDLVYRQSRFSDIEGQFVKPFLQELERLVKEILDGGGGGQPGYIGAP